MKKMFLTLTMVSGLLIAGCASESAKQSKLAAQAKISKDDALKIAQTKAPTGTVKESELENEKGKLIWSFEFAVAGEKGSTEVNVDAITGDIVSVEHEN